MREQKEPPQVSRGPEPITGGMNGHAHDEPPPAAWAVPLGIGDDEWLSARLAPDCIVENYLYADVALLVAPGSTGKTTLTLYESICIVLGRDLWGEKVLRPGPIVFVTAEDRREQLVARIREMSIALDLPPAQVTKVRADLRIDDRTTTLLRLSAVVADVVVASSFAEEIVAACRAESVNPSVVQFDPLMSFGVGESRVNDAEQALIEAARIIRNGLNCCVRYVHHTGKGPAKDGDLSQYASRGGSALPDGARMVAVMQTLTPPQWLIATGNPLDIADPFNREGAIRLARPKCSYAPPNQPDVLIRRRRYLLSQEQATKPQDRDVQRRLDADAVLAFVEAELAAGREHSARSLDDVGVAEMARPRTRAAVAELRLQHRIVDLSRPKKGGAQSCIWPASWAVPDGAANGAATP